MFSQKKFLLPACSRNLGTNSETKNTEIVCHKICFDLVRVSVQGVKSLGGHFAFLCRGFEFYEVRKEILLFFKKKMKILLHC